MNIIGRAWKAIKGSVSIVTDAFSEDDMAEVIKELEEKAGPIPPVLRHVVIPKEYINTMPVLWQADFHTLMQGLRAAKGYNALRHEFQILKRDRRGRFEDFPNIKERQEAARKADELF